MTRRAGVQLLAALSIAFAALVPAASAKDYVLEDWDGPAPVGSWYSNPSLDTKGWAPVVSDPLTFGTWTGATWWAPKGLYATAKFALFAGPGTGEWQWQAPGSSTVYRAEYGPVITHTVGCVNEGMRSSAGGWQASVNNAPGGTARASAHPTACTPGAWVPWTPSGQIFIGALGRQVFCSAAACSRLSSPTGNRAVFGVQRTRAVQPQFDAYLPGARLYLTDYDKPTITAGTNSLTGWVNTGTGTVTATATDAGLGVKSVTITGPSPLTGSAASKTTALSCTGDRNDRCPATWNTTKPNTTASLGYDVATLPEGINPFNVTATDIVDNTSVANATAIPAIKVDRTAAGNIAATGPLVDGQNHYFNGTDPQTVTITATDPAAANGQQLSGIRTIRIEEAGGATLVTRTLACSEQCSSSANETLTAPMTGLSEGAHQLRAVVTDLAGNTQAGTSWTAYVDRTPPTPAAGAIELTEYDPTTATALLGVAQTDDPQLPGDVPGVGLRGCEFRVGAGGQWTALDESGITASAQVGTTLDVALRCVDNVGNRAETSYSIAVSAVDPPDTQDFPVADAPNATLLVRPWTKSQYNPAYSTDAAMPDMPVSYRRVGAATATGVLTSADGVARLDVPAGDYEVWLPQSVDPRASVPRRVTASTDPSSPVDIAVDVTGGATSARSSVAAVQTTGDLHLASSLEDSIANAQKCKNRLPVIARGFCLKLRAMANRVYAIEAILWGTNIDGLRQDSRMNAFQHSFATAYAVRIAQKEFNVYSEVISPDVVLDIIMSIEDDARVDPEIDTRRASYQDRNNNNVGFNFQLTNTSYSAPMLCSSMRSKSFNARKVSFPSGLDYIPGNPLPRDQTQLIYFRTVTPNLATPSSRFPANHPCTYAFKKTDAP